MHYFFSILFCITLYGGACYCSDRPKTHIPAVKEKESLLICYLRDGEVPAPPVFEGDQEGYDQDQRDYEQICQIEEDKKKSQEEIAGLWEELKDSSKEEIVKRARQAFQEKDYPHAIEVYRILNSIYPFSEYAEVARLGIIKSYYGNKDMEKLVIHANQFIQLYPTSQYVEEVFKLRGMAYAINRKNLSTALRVDFSEYRDKEELMLATTYLTDYLHRFPNGIYRTEIQEKLHDISVLIATLEYHNANFYFNRKEYIAAYNRIVDLLDIYSDRPDLISPKKIKRLKAQHKQLKQKLLI